MFTPHARLYHHESASFGPRKQDSRETDRMRAMWGDAVDRDPYYNPHLTKEHLDYRVQV